MTAGPTASARSAGITALVCIVLGIALAPIGVGVPLLAWGIGAAFVAACFALLAHWIGGVP